MSSIKNLTSDWIGKFFCSVFKKQIIEHIESCDKCKLDIKIILEQVPMLSFILKNFSNKK